MFKIKMYLTITAVCLFTYNIRVMSSNHYYKIKVVFTASLSITK